MKHEHLAGFVALLISKSVFSFYADLKESKFLFGNFIAEHIIAWRPIALAAIVGQLHFN